MPKRMFNGNEIAFLAGCSEENDDDERFIVQTKHLGSRSDGYEYDLLTVKHPDGKFYQFEFAYNSEHGIYPCRERPEKLVEAYEVVPVIVPETIYKRVEEGDPRG